MAEVLLVVQGVLRKVLQLAGEEISSLWGLKQDLQSLAEKLEMIQALLSDAESKHLTSRVVQLWIKKLQAVATEADDALDEYTYVLLQKKIEGSLYKVIRFFSPSNPLLFHVEMARKIKKINQSLEEGHKNASNMGIRPAEVIDASVSTLREIRQTDPFVDDSQIVGRKNDISEIVSMLTSSNSGTSLPVISIVGMPGQGKTTLAQLVYKNEKVLRHFDKRLWVCVSDDFIVERLLSEMFQSLTLTNFELTNREAIVKKLQGHLKGQRYFLVLDDVWNENPDKWDSMRKCLLEIGGSKGSKIVVTTRSDAVTLTVQASHSHRLQVLSREDSWTLFKKIAFADGGAIECSALVAIGRRILEKCKGIPLAIKALAGLLYSRKEESEWLAIEQSEFWGSLGSTDSILPSLRLSYNHLPLLSLKRCFIYCSIFPKDFVMEKEKLVQFWIAQGLINSEGSRLEMEDTGNNFFNVLLRSSFLQDAKRDEYDSIKSCTMHDLVHDLAMHISKGYCLTVNVNEEAKDEIQATHLLAVSYERKMVEVMQEIASRLRTLHLIGVSLGDMLIGFRYLRVLIMDNFYVMKLPRWIGKLKHLRYLDIQKTSISRLPNSITKLYNLQTLRVNALEEMPNKFQNLINLRHFYMKDNIHTRKNCILSGIGRLVCIQTLPFFVVSRERRCLIEELGGLHNLKGEVKIYGLENVGNGEAARRANLSAKVNIHNLELNWSTRTQEFNDTNVLEGLKPHTNLKGLTVRNFEGSKFPSWMVTSEQSMLLWNLVKIRLDNCNKCKQIPTLGHLPKLKIVLIRKLHNVKRIGEDFYGSTNHGDSTNGSALIAFPALQEFTLSGMSTLIGWSHAIPSFANVFPQLDRFVIEDCPELDDLPNFKSLPSLRQLTISMCKKLSRLPDWLQSLSALEILKISGCSNLRSIPGISNLQSLQKMSITNCDRLSILPAGLEACMSLEWLNIQFCPVLQPEGAQWLSGLKELEIGYFSDNLVTFPFPNFSEVVNYSSSSNTNDHTPQLCFNIRSLKLYGWQRVECLPTQLQHLLGLRVLTLWGFEGLEVLPEWLGNLSSLQILELYHCKNLKYLPSLQAMEKLVNLRELEIFGCRLLDKRCTLGKRPEWHKIAHIPIVQVNYQSVRPS